MSQDLTLRLGSHLLEKKLITEEQLSVATQEQAVTGELLGQVLVRLGFMQRRTLISVLAEISPQSLVGDSNFDIEIPHRVLLETKSMVMSDTGTDLYFATLSEDPEQVMERFRPYLGDTRKVHLTTGDYHQIRDYLSKIKRSDNVDTTDVTEDINGIITKILEGALQAGASDIHLEPTESTIRVRCRVDGMLRVFKVLDLEFANRLFSRVKDRAGMDISEKRLPQDGSFTMTYRGRRVDFRVASIPSAHGEKITLRVLDKERLVVDLASAGFSVIEQWKALATHTNGIILVCGPTGSGKTTTLYSTIKLLDTLHKAVYMIEDPIEYKVPFVVQSQVNNKAGMGFPAFIRTVLRHDPDVVVVGEIRDEETANIALRLADTGHLVYATLHTNDVPSSITRLKSFGIGQEELSFLLRGVLVQKLFRLICVECKGLGCPACDYSRYRGRNLLAEFAAIDNEHDLQRILDHDKTYHTFADDARLKLAQGVTDLEEIRRVLNGQFNPEVPS